MDRLLEISDRVYVFDCCFSTEALEEYEYKVYLAGIVAQLQHSYPDSSFMVFNFKETDTRTQISDILSQYDMTVMEYPRQYEGCSLLPLEMIHHFLRSCESWLSLAGQQNMILVHCERGGWPVLAFMLAALLLFRKQYNGEQQTLEMVYKQAPRELLCVLTSINAQPSQLRYLQYISRRTVGSDWPPSDRPLALDHIVLRFLPLFDEKGCRPVIRIFGQDSPSTTVNRDSKLLFTSSGTEKEARYYQLEECELINIDIHQHVQGDVVLECIHLEHGREELIFRVMFHTSFVPSKVLILSCDDVDVLWDARDQMLKNFKAEVRFSDANALPPMFTIEGEFEDKNGTNCLTHEVEEIIGNVVHGQDGLLPKEFKVNAENGDIAPRPPPPPPIYVAPSPQITPPFQKEFEHLKIQLKEIKSATDNFGENKLIGRGGFGKVYLGEVSHSRGKSMSAFKRLDPRYGQGDPEFWKEILMLSDYKHKNLISLLGFCDEGGERILVYEYASNGSLDRHLSSTRLTWIQRIKICLDAARGLSFLHDDKGTMQRVLHRDIKSANILLDDKWNAKVSDMGLSKIGPANQPHTFIFTSKIVGTPGYCDPQYMYSFTLSKESDVYSFGVVLFEVLCGRLCFTQSNGKLDKILVPVWKKAYVEKKLHEIVFQDLTQPMNSTSLEIFSGIAYQCLHKYREDRPTIAHVVEKLETALEFQKPPNKYEDGLKVKANRVRPPPIRRAPPPQPPQSWIDDSPPSSPPLGIGEDASKRKELLLALQLKPHSAIWRLVHEMAVIYLVALTILLFQTRDKARQFMKYLHPDLGVELSERSYGVDCRLYVPENPTSRFINVYETLFDKSVPAQIFGWWGKAIIIRNQPLLWVLSLASELMELTFRHMLPCFNECWWDSIVIDILICNWFGIWVGMHTVRHFDGNTYKWVGISRQPYILGKVKRSLGQFTPAQWDKNERSPLLGPWRFIQVFSLCIVFLTVELNTFFLKFCLWVPPRNPIIVCRLVLWWLIAIPTIQEYNSHLQDRKQLGAFCWLSLVICIIELFICIKFGQGLFPSPMPRWLVIMWTSAGVIFLNFLMLWTWQSHRTRRRKRK